MLPAPGFHHLHLNSVDPEAAIGFYTRQFASTSKAEWGGFPALAAPNDVLVLFTKVDRPAPHQPQSAIWHFGWHVPDSRATLERFRGRAEVRMLPLYTGDGEGAVHISSDTWPGAGGVLGRTKPQIAEAKTSGVEPTRVGGFAYMLGPDDALVEFAGNHPQERFNHVHMWQEDPVMAQRWYQEHLNAPTNPGSSSASETSIPRSPDRTFPSLDRDGSFRTPRAGVQFGDVSVMWYANQTEKPLSGSLGQLQDHLGLSVADLDAWVAKLRAEGVRFLAEPYRLGDTRAVMIEGPSREAIELVEVR
jgi:catechol 2,3-dioxygenase-like lactoylglutathione lyase family enzyme